MRTKLLVAEDNALFRGLIQQSLSSDFDVTLAEDGLTAWEILKKNREPIIAILDWVMPGMTGPEVCRQVRTDLNWHSNYLMLLTAKNSPSDIVAGLASGADDYITKPFQPEELRARVHLAERILDLQTTVEHQRIQASSLDLNGISQRSPFPPGAAFRHRCRKNRSGHAN